MQQASQEASVRWHQRAPGAGRARSRRSMLSWETEMPGGLHLALEPWKETRTRQTPPREGEANHDKLGEQTRGDVGTRRTECHCTSTVCNNALRHLSGVVWRVVQDTFTAQCEFIGTLQHRSAQLHRRAQPSQPCAVPSSSNEGASSDLPLTPTCKHPLACLTAPYSLAATLHPSPVTRHPSPATRNRSPSAAAGCHVLHCEPAHAYMS